MSIDNKVKNYTTLNNYTASLGVPVNPSPFESSVQILPYFDGMDYVNPNYNSLIIGSGCNNYPTITQGYMDNAHNCVSYASRSIPCGPKGDDMNLNQKPFLSKEHYARNSPYSPDNSCNNCR
jgi:hypothetical protein